MYKFKSKVLKKKKIHDIMFLMNKQRETAMTVCF